MTAGDLIKRSLRLIGAIASGETPSAAEQSDALASLNSMLSTWSTDNLLIPIYSREVFSLEAGKAQYTMGSSGDFDTDRPLLISNAAALAAGSDYEFPVNVLNIQEWSDISLKTTQAPLVSMIYHENTSPLATINVYPVPSVANSIVLTSKKVLASFASATDTFSLPEGYEDLVVYNLAVRLAPEFGKEIKASVMMIANDTLYAVERLNRKPVYMKSDAAGLSSGRRYNILSGE